jgi:hypothetical protein
MEADWETEIGPDAPIIDALWPGFVDLRREPHRIAEIPEAALFPTLANALLLINDPTSSFWSSKCDSWPLDHCDPDEMEASEEEFTAAEACYIDLLPYAGQAFSSLAAAEGCVRTVVNQLRRISCSCSRADLAIRQALVADQEGFAITAYIAGCGIDQNAARAALSEALAVFVNTLREIHPNKEQIETLQ